MSGRMVRFDKPCMNLAGAVEYFREHLKVGDYLTEDGQAPMVWFGRGAEQLGLSGVCDLDAFTRLCRGQDPQTGEKLGVRDKGAQRRLCFFGQISAPKDVSIAYLVGGDTRIGLWWQEAVRETLQEIEAAVATRVRRTGANEDRTTGNMITAVVTHESSRALDPQLHTHVCIMNLTFDATENRWKSVQPSDIYRNPTYLREVCYNKLAERLLAAGYELEPARGVGFNIRGFPEELRTTFSKRRVEILRRAAEAGVSSQAALQAITVQSRAEKTNATAADLRAGWLEQAGDKLAAVHAAITAAEDRRAPAPLDANEALASAEAHLFERQSVVSDRVLLREALETGRGRVELSSLKRAIARRVEAGELVRVEGELGSREALEVENEFLRWAGSQLEVCGPLGSFPADSNIDAGQQRVVADLVSSTSRVVVLQGDAGTGKTTCLRAVVAGIEQAGGRVFGCAPSAGAADVLRKELTPDANTLQQLLVNESLQLATRGRVLIVDEAGLISARQMRDLCRLAAANDNRLVLVGDIKQHTSVEAGDALRCLQHYAHVPVVYLTEIRRQRDPAMRRAVAMLAKGDARAAFNEFRVFGAVEEIASETKLYRAAAEDYVTTIAAGRSCLAISPVWAEIHAFTDEVRRQLKAAGLLAAEERTIATVFSLQWTREQHRRIEQYQAGDALTFHRDAGGFTKGETVTVVRRDADRLIVRGSDGGEHPLDPKRVTGFDTGLARDIPVAVGDRLLIRANLRTHRLKNGDIVEVAGFAGDGAITLKDGRTLPAEFRQFSHGYATTSHSAQGKTVDRGILIMAEAGIAAGNLKQAYVSNSRFRESQMIYTTDTDAARDAMGRPADRKLATELVRPQPVDTYRQWFLWKIHSLGRPPTRADWASYGRLDFEPTAQPHPGVGHRA